MFTVQLYYNHAYRDIKRRKSLAAAGLAAQTLSTPGKFRVLSAKGDIVLKGRVVSPGEVKFE